MLLKVKKMKTQTGNYGVRVLSQAAPAPRENDKGYVVFQRSGQTYYLELDNRTIKTVNVRLWIDGREQHLEGGYFQLSSLQITNLEQGAQGDDLFTFYATASEAGKSPLQHNMVHITFSPENEKQSLHGHMLEEKNLVEEVIFFLVYQNSPFVASSLYLAA